MAPDDLRVVMITGAGDRAFCAGGDLKERNGMTDSEWFAQHLVYERMVRAVVGCPCLLLGQLMAQHMVADASWPPHWISSMSVKARASPRQKQSSALFQVRVALRILPDP